MRKFLYAFMLVVGTLTPLTAQISSPYQLFGSYADLDGNLLHEYADQDYAPALKLSVFHNSQTTHTTGTYYTAEGAAHKGYILYGPGTNKFSYKQSVYAKDEKVKPEAGWALTVGADSFIVVKGHVLLEEIGMATIESEKPVILNYIGKTKQFAFFKYIPAAGKSRIIVRDLATQELTGLPLGNKAFCEKAAAVFTDYPALVALIQEKQLKADAGEQLLRFIQFSEAQQFNKPILYTANWEITEDPAQGLYYAVVSKPTTNWQLDFYNKADQKLFSEHFANALPAINEGETCWYYPETGVPRKKTAFTVGKSDKRTTIFHANGNVHYEYIITHEGKAKYLRVVGVEGTSLVNSTGSGTEEYWDESAKRTIYREFKNYFLISSYYLDEQKRKIYQVAQHNAKLRALNALNTALASDVVYSAKAIATGEQGVVLVKLIIAPDDQLESYSLLQGVGTFTNTMAMALVRGETHGFHVKSGKQGKEEVYQEVVVPVCFSLIRQSENRYYYYDPFQMHHLRHPTFTPPTKPGF